MMKISDLFDVKYGVNLELINCEETSDANAVNFVARTSQNNGVVAKVRRIPGIEPQPAGTLTVATGGSVLSTFVQIKPYYSGRDLYILTPKKEMTFNEKLFYAMCIRHNAFRYNYGRQANKTLNDIEIPSVVPKKYKDYKIDYSILETDLKPEKIDISHWKYIKLEDLFEVKGTKTTSIDELETYGKGEYPYVTTQSTNNAVCNKYKYYTEKGNVLVIDSAVKGFCSYQEKNFSASDHVEKLVPKIYFNKYIGLFLATIINKENFKYSYGRKFNQDKIKTTKIKVPVNKNGEIDLVYIEKYIKKLPYSEKI